MAIGDIEGDLPTTYMRQQIAANQVAARQASLKDASIPKTESAGPVGRAQQKLGAAAPASLYQAGGASPIGVTPLVPPSREPAPTVSLNDAAPTPSAQSAPAAPARIDGQFRPTGAGATPGYSGGQIVARQGANGIAEFSNIAADQGGAQGLGSISAQPQAPAGVRAMSLESLPVVRGVGGRVINQAEQPVSLGSALNIGDGLGTFSQSAPGDAALAASRFAKAAQIREDGANKDRLQRAIGRQSLADSINVVRDSSKPLTLAEQQQMGIDQQARKARLEDIGVAQELMNATQQGRMGDLSLSRATGLEALRAKAADPSATAEDQESYLRASDPAGYLKARQSAGSAALTNQKTQLEIDKLQAESKQKQEDRAAAKESAAATFDQALASIDNLAGVEGDPGRPEHPGLQKALGPLDALAPTIPGSDAANFEARLDTLKAQTFLPQVAALKGAGALSDAEGKKLSDSVGALSLKMSEDEFRKSLQEVHSTLQSARDRSQKGGNKQQPSSAKAAASGGLQVGDVQDGYVYQGGDPSSQSSWRPQ